jgi:hypothetical protein
MSAVGRELIVRTRGGFGNCRNAMRAIAKDQRAIVISETASNPASSAPAQSGVLPRECWSPPRAVEATAR